MRDQSTLNEHQTGNQEGPNETTVTPERSRFWGKIPADWSITSGSGEAYEVNPSHEPDTDENTYIEMDALDTELPHPKYFGTRKAEDYSGKTFTEGDVLFARITPCTENGKAAIVPEMESRVGIGSTEYAVLSPEIDELVPHFLYYLTKSHPIHDYAISRMRGSTGRQRVPFDVFRREIDLPLPPLSEQRKIASVLYNVDEAIRKTEEIIEQTKRVKDGIRQDIFEYGLTANGEMRERDPEVDGFKESEYGDIPQEWEVVTLQKLVPDDVPITYGIVKPGDHVPEGIPVIKAEDIKNEKIVPGELLRTDPEIHEQYDRAELQEGDLLLTIRGTVGRTAFVPKELDGANITQDTARIRVTEAIPEFVRQYFETELPRKFMERRTVGQAVQGINLEDVRKLPVLLPPKEEQEQMIKLLKMYTKQIHTERDYLERLIQLKQGLMQDLLTGEVRTKDRDIEVMAEVEAHG